MRRRAAPVRALVAALTLLATLMLASACAASAGAPGGGPAGAPAAASPPPNPLAADGLQDPARDSEWRDDHAAATPVAVRVPSLGVQSRLETLGVGADGALQPPSDYDSAGWFGDGVAPGDVGPAIIAGHVDSPVGPAVFARLAELGPGATILVDLSDGRSLTFAVTGSQQSAKAQFPTADVYSTVPRPELRLITCAGVFDSTTDHYVDNLIVYAALVG